MITFDSIEFSSDGNWHFDWSSSGSSTDEFDVYLNGMLAAQVVGTNYDCAQLLTYHDDPPNIEVVPKGTLAESVINQPFVTLQWHESTNAVAYLVEYNSSGTWVTVGNVTGTVALPLFISGFLNDGTHTFRITAYDTYQQASTPLEVSKEVIRNPEFAHNNDKVVIEYQNPNILIYFEGE